MGANAQLPRPSTERVPPHLYFVGSAIFHYLGPAFAVLLFASIDPLGVAWLRIASAALIFAVWRRPWRRWALLTRSARGTLLGLGITLAVMNSAFYLAIDRMPLGTVAAIEFLPVIVLAALGARNRRNGIAVVLAAAGVYLLTEVQWDLSPIGLAFASVNAVLFGVYVVLAHRIASGAGVTGVDGLALAMLIAAVIALPIGIADAAPAFADPVVLLAAVGVGVSSSVIPYVCDQLAMARLARGTYALLVSLLPATATVIGLIVLGQVPAVAEAAGVGLVVIAVAAHRAPDQVAGSQ